VGGTGAVVLIHGVGGTGAVVLIQGVGGTGAVVLAQGVGGTGAVVLATVMLFSPTALANINMAKTVATNDLLIDPSE
jgi:hypothetical protein